MKRPLAVSAILCVAFVFNAHAQVDGQFVGSYEFGEDGGKTYAGDPIAVGHVLQIEADGSATLLANGYQTARDLICTAKSAGSKVLIYFTQYNAEGVNVFTDYEAGQLLLTLEYRTVKGGKVLWTTWGAYRPVIDEPESWVEPVSRG